MYVNRFQTLYFRRYQPLRLLRNSIIMLCFVMFLYSSTCALFARLRQPTQVTKIFSNFGLLLGPRRIMHACLDPKISCSSSTNGSIVVFSVNKVGNKNGFVSPPFLSCTTRNTRGLLSSLSRGTDNVCSVAPSVTSGSFNETPRSFFSSSSKPPSLANVLVVTGVVSIGFVSPALGIFSALFSYTKACSRSFFCPRVRSKVAMSSVWTNFKAWESRQLFPSSSIVFCISLWSLHHSFKSKARHNGKKQ